MGLETQGNTHVMRRTGWVLSGLVIAFMVVDAGTTLLAIEPVKKATLETGYPLDLRWLIGALQLICLVLYAIPATSVVSAIILTGFLGGAVTSHLRVAGTLTPEMILSLIVGVLAWGGQRFRNSTVSGELSGGSGVGCGWSRTIVSMQATRDDRRRVREMIRAVRADGFGHSHSDHCHRPEITAAS